MKSASHAAVGRDSRTSGLGLDHSSQALRIWPGSSSLWRSVRIFRAPPPATVNRARGSTVPPPKGPAHASRGLCAAPFLSIAQRPAALANGGRDGPSLGGRQWARRENPELPLRPAQQVLSPNSVRLRAATTGCESELRLRLRLRLRQRAVDSETAPRLLVGRPTRCPLVAIARIHLRPSARPASLLCTERRST